MWLRQRWLLSLVLVITLLLNCAVAWTKEDHEIFRLKDELEANEGKDVTFYDFLGIKPSASLDDINKAYRKMSRQLHPDKARQSFLATYAKPTTKSQADKKKKPGVTVRKQPTQKEIAAFSKTASARFARLGVVANILRGPMRDRYDHFLQNGFPAWRGTGYYYSRFRPGLGSVLIGLFVVGGGAAHYGALYLSWKRQRDFVDRYIRHARRMAWGNEVGIPGIDADASSTAQQSATSAADEPATAWNRKERRRMDRETKKEKDKGKDKAKPNRTSAEPTGTSTPSEQPKGPGPQGAKKRVEAPNGKVLIVDSVGDVYLEEHTEEGDRHEYLLDVDEIPKPSIYDTYLFRLPKYLYARTVGRLFGTTAAGLAAEALAESYAEGEDSDLKSATATNPNAEMRKRKAKARQR